MQDHRVVDELMGDALVVSVERHTGIPQPSRPEDPLAHGQELQELVGDVDVLVLPAEDGQEPIEQGTRRVAIAHGVATHDLDEGPVEAPGHDGVDATIQRQVELLLKAGPIAAASAKALVRNVAAASGPVAIDTANAELIARLRVSPEGQEGINAFLEKRKPSWVK